MSIEKFVLNETSYFGFGAREVLPAFFNLSIKSIVCSCLKNSYKLFAEISPISFVIARLSIEACIKFSMVLYFLANVLAAFTPICLIPSAAINLYKSLFLLLFIASIRFCVNFFPFFFNVAISSNSKKYMSC